MSEPFSMTVVSSGPTFRLCDFEFEASTRRLRNLQTHIELRKPLPPKQAQLLELLLLNCDKSVPNYQIMNTIWQANNRLRVAVARRNRIANLLHQLRKKLGKQCGQRLTASEDSVRLRCGEPQTVEPSTPGQVEAMLAGLYGRAEAYVSGSPWGVPGEGVSRYELRKLVDDHVWSSLEGALPIVMDLLLQLIVRQMKPPPKGAARMPSALSEFNAIRTPAVIVSEDVRDAIREALKERRRKISEDEER